MYLLDKNFCPSVETKPDPRSIEGLIAWLETMPADKAYNWWDPCACVYAQYRDATPALHENTRLAVLLDGPNPFDAYAQIGSRDPWTMGAALIRARAYQAKVRT